jgi:AcrR family transcriptional regulator
MGSIAKVSQALALEEIDAVYDPSLPIHYFPGQARAALSRRNQRLRRAQILATIRQMLTEDGFEGVTVRRVAQASGHAVQTIYNLVGPRDRAIVEAISEYTRYVGRTASPRPEDPQAVMTIIDCWLRSVEAAPEFCRRVSLIYFTPARDVFYSFRDRELKGMQGLLSRQQKCGAIRPEASVRDLAEQLVLFASASCVDWSDRPYPVEQLRRRLYSGYANLLAGAIARPRIAAV